MKKITGKICFGGNTLIFNFSQGNMDVDVETDRAFSYEEVTAVNAAIDSLTRICADIEKKIDYDAADAFDPFAFLKALIPSRRTPQREEHRYLSISNIKFSSKAKRIPDANDEKRFFIELDGLRLIEENGEIVGWYIP